MVVIGGILVIAISDALSDAMGIHISEEAEHRHTEKEIWESTIATFLSKFFLSMTFLVPILFLELSTAIVACVLWGLSLITLFSFYIARRQGIRPHRPVIEHLGITAVVIAVTHFLGGWVATLG
ncbi:MAG: hypothetical protein A2Z06_02255 [Candidatus Glassbacteria bacterium RBG_16_58_8]|uniref:VIT family protein n=1 Tax=Candidatus Glassbacteria bacterium RBG_16_58_8 TaxID=1817866 RepID=A0A1F5YC98_9BACT|nr:MAG: hypothetical protein A2Z06_02255 [Candidatus Glassbacteria bacterium RBG_16_58_8]